jgi:hypothetical protein
MKTTSFELCTSTGILTIILLQIGDVAQGSLPWIAWIAFVLAGIFTVPTVLHWKAVVMSFGGRASINPKPLQRRQRTKRP